MIIGCQPEDLNRVILIHSHLGSQSDVKPFREAQVTFTITENSRNPRFSTLDEFCASLCQHNSFCSNWTFFRIWQIFVSDFWRMSIEHFHLWHQVTKSQDDSTIKQMRQQHWIPFEHSVSMYQTQVRVQRTDQWAERFELNNKRHITIREKRISSVTLDTKWTSYQVHQMMSLRIHRQQHQMWGKLHQRDVYRGLHLSEVEMEDQERGATKSLPSCRLRVM